MDGGNDDAHSLSLSAYCLLLGLCLSVNQLNTNVMSKSYQSYLHEQKAMRQKANIGKSAGRESITFQDVCVEMVDP
jgi:hypothetical protein